jgi:DNA-binding MarR family transcriptional regulator
VKNDPISRIRAFNRFYTTVIGVTNNNIYQSDYSLTEVRVMFEACNNPGITARQLKTLLKIDEGYLSRLVAKLVKKKILVKKQSREDKRVFSLELSESGKRIFGELNKRSSEDISELVRHLTEEQLAELLSHLDRLKALLTKPKENER